MIGIRLNSSFSSGNLIVTLLVCVLAVIMFGKQVSGLTIQDYFANEQGYNRNDRTGTVLAEIEQPKQTMAILQALIQAIQDATPNNSPSGFSKRGLDLGLSRGFSGSKAAKHLMGLATAQFANGPGR